MEGVRPGRDVSLERRDWKSCLDEKWGAMVGPVCAQEGNQELPVKTMELDVPRGWTVLLKPHRSIPRGP